MPELSSAREWQHLSWSYAAKPDDGAGTPSLLEQFMAQLRQRTGWQVSFDDLTGGDCGIHSEVPELRLSLAYQCHLTCKLCVFARRSNDGSMACVRNKLAVNRVVLRRQRGLAGLCHLGLFEIVEPLVFRQVVLGVFFFGSVVLRERRRESRARVRRYCQRHGLAPAGYLRRLEALPVVAARAVPEYRAMLLPLVGLARYICENAGVRPELYQRKPLMFPYSNWLGTPYLVKATVNHVNRHLSEPFNVKQIADALKCHPDFLSRKFKEHTGRNLGDYLRDLRVERAKSLLHNPKISVEHAAGLAGFSDRIHFSKVFHRVTGQTPLRYKQQCLRQSSGNRT
ncbi:MAG: helix-turn-helix domain-containing protein [Verrucomicrobiales bacterium]|jgi:AraC-like DNA-binding protein|nr:helix-turn-helix domain-containing protein [Verrucomicrobiales bacterium]